MPNLLQSLQGSDLGYLRIVASFWGLEFDAADAKSGALWLVGRLLNSDLINEVVTSLPDRALMALADIMRNSGRMPWSGFSRRYGTLREMGAARRDRERPYLDGASPAEMLFYRALIGRAFFDTSKGTEEFAYIPDDMIDLLPAMNWEEKPFLGRPASPGEKLFILPGSDCILDDACTLLAGLRLGMSFDDILQFMQTGVFTPYPLTPQDLVILLKNAGLLNFHSSPIPEPTRVFLEAPRGEALAFLVRTWLGSVEFDDLRRIPGVTAEGEWVNDPLRARQAVLNFLSTIPGAHAIGDTNAERPLWGLKSFINAVKQVSPDFQREAGEYDSWHLRDQVTGEFLRGFENWLQVEGALIQFIIIGPLYWMGIVDLGLPYPLDSNSEKVVTSFRFSTRANDLLDGLVPGGFPEEKSFLLATSDGRLRAPPYTPRVARYQIARFSQWDGYKDREYQYRLTPDSLIRARQQGLRVDHLISLLRKQTKTFPPTLVQALQRWENYGAEARLENVTVLRLHSPELLTKLRASRARRFLGEPLGPNSVIVKPGTGEKVLLILAEMGYLGEIIQQEL